MCGIAGWYSARAAAETRIHRLRHRGPNGIAEYRSANGQCQLSLARLALVRPDLPAQVARAGGLASVANGEIYDHHAWATRLGVPPSVDTDLLPHLWRAFGPTFLKHLRGPLAAAIFDEQTNQLFLLRDAVGKRPLYWAPIPGGIVFASEIKALPSRVLETEANPDFVDGVLSRGFVDEEVTPFRAVRILMPGQCLRVGVAGVSITQIDQLEPQGRSTIDDVLTQLLEATRLRKTDEVRTSVALGGMDSLVLSDLLGHPHGYTVDRREDETARALAARKSLEASPPTVLNQQTADRVSTRRSLWHLETVDATATWQLSASTLGLADAVAQAGNRALFTGEGADELFLGYPWQLDRLRGKLPAPMVMAGGIAAKIPAAWMQWLQHARAWERVRFYATPAAALLPKELNHLAGHAISAPAPSDRTAQLEAEYGLERTLQIEALRDDMHVLPVRHNDRLFMAVGVETRMPFLDRKVIDAALGLPKDAFSANEGEAKPVVRALYLRSYGEHAPDKIGYSGAGVPTPEGLLSWVRDRAATGHSLTDRQAMLELAASPSWLKRQLAWRALLLEELYSVLRAGPQSVTC